MKKLFIIIALTAIQSACSTPPAQPDPQGTLLSFTDLATEIKISREATPPVPVSSTTAIEDLGDSS